MEPMDEAADIRAKIKAADLAALRAQREAQRPPPEPDTDLPPEPDTEQPVPLPAPGLTNQDREDGLRALAELRAEEAEQERVLLAVQHPEDNPEWDRATRTTRDAAPKRTIPNQKELLSEFVDGHRADTNMLDDTIYQMRMSGMGSPDIARRLGSTVSTEFVDARIREQLAKRNTMTAGEYRWLQIGRYEAVINMLWGLAEAGSDKHIPLLLMALERLNKMHELEKETARVEIEIISDGQAQAMKGACALVIERFLSIPGVREAVSREILEQTVGEALADAADIIDAPDTRILQQAS